MISMNIFSQVQRAAKKEHMELWDCVTSESEHNKSAETRSYFPS